MDLISRQAAIDGADAIIARDTSGNNDVVKAMTAWKSYVEALPSAQPEQKKGKWILHKDWEYDGECAYECSVCGMGSDVDYDFCMRCGADMRGETDE